MSEKRILWRGRGSVATRAAGDVTDADLALINQYTDGSATAADVWVARIMVCNDQVDHYSTQFTLRALDQISRLIVGANGMRNHNEYGSEDLPISRCFRAFTTVDGAGVNWVAADVYWPKGTDCGDDMATNVRLGIWREVSLSWWMNSFTNSVDGKPFSESPYYCGQVLKDGQTVIGIMDDVVEVNEYSIVARGGQIGTSIGNVRDKAEEDASVAGLVRAARARNKTAAFVDVDTEAASWFTRWAGAKREAAAPPMSSTFPWMRK